MIDNNGPIQWKLIDSLEKERKGRRGGGGGGEKIEKSKSKLVIIFFFLHRFPRVQRLNNAKALCYHRICISYMLFQDGGRFTERARIS